MPVAVAAGIGAVGAVAGAALQSSAVGAAAEDAQWTQMMTAEMQRLENNRAREDLQTWRESGQRANMIAGDLAGNYGPAAAQHRWNDAMLSPSYQWRFDEGLRAIDAGAAASGMLRSGAQLKAEQKYGQDMASQEFENYYNRLFSLSAQGLGAAGGQANVSVESGKGLATAGRGIAETQASAGTAQANILGNAVSGLTGIANNYAQGQLYQNRTNALLAQQQPFASTPVYGAVGGGYGLGGGIGAIGGGYGLGY